MNAPRPAFALAALLLVAGAAIDRATGAGPRAAAPSVAIAPAPAAPAAATEPRLVVLVRHAEKGDTPPDDPPLTEAGRARAQALVAALKDAGVTAIVTSDARRTRETARPLAEALGIAPVAVAAGAAGLEAHIAAVAAEVRRHRGEVVLVVGHSDTIPAIIRALGGDRLPRIRGVEFDDLFVLLPGADGGRLVRSRYGASVAP